MAVNSNGEIVEIRETSGILAGLMAENRVFWLNIRLRRAWPLGTASAKVIAREQPAGLCIGGFTGLRIFCGAAMIAALATRNYRSAAGAGEGPLWATALAISLLVNVLIVAMLGVVISLSPEKSKPVPAPRETLVVLVPPRIQVPADETPEPEPDAPDPRFARTSEDQRSLPPDSAAFIGERDTQATSDAAPDANAPRLPSQAGEEPRHAADLETTQSDFQEGPDDPSQPSPPLEAVVPPAPPTPAAEAAMASAARPGEEVEEPGPDEASVEGARETAATALNPVDVPVPAEPLPEMTETVPPERPEEGLPDMAETGEATATAAETPPPPRQPIQDPAFRSNQRKAAISGSIARTGTSALDVADTPTGRYQAAISKAVEQEWRRNCVRHRDFITPGFLSVRFFVQQDGKVSSVQFVGNMHTGEIQKGFTLSSIRDAPIPAMPAPVRKELDGEPLELIFNFYF